MELLIHSQLPHFIISQDRRDIDALPIRKFTIMTFSCFLKYAELRIELAVYSAPERDVGIYVGQ